MIPWRYFVELFRDCLLFPRNIFPQLDFIKNHEENFEKKIVENQIRYHEAWQGMAEEVVPETKPKVSHFNNTTKNEREETKIQFRFFINESLIFPFLKSLNSRDVLQAPNTIKQLLGSC